MKKEIVKHIVQFSSSNLVLQGAIFIQNLFIANLLGPSSYGIFNALQLITIYSWVLQFGVIDGMQREIPILRGSGKNDEIKLIKDVGLSYTLLCGFLALTILFISLPFLKTTSEIKFGLICIAFVAFFGLVGNFYGLTFRAENRFGLVSRLLLVNAMIAILTIPLIVSYKFYGAFLSLVLASAGTLGYAYYKYRPFYSFEVKWNLKVLKPLVIVGFPIMLLSYTAGLSETVDRLLILFSLSNTELGYYAAPKTIVGAIGALLLVPITSVMYPRFTEQYGKTKRLEDLFPLIDKPISILCLIIPVFTGALFVGIPQIVMIFLPAYTSGIHPAQVLLVGASFLSVFGVVGNFYPTINKVFHLYLFHISAVIMTIIISCILIKFGIGITGVAIGRSIACFLYIILAFCVSMSLMNKPFRQSLVFLFQKFIPILYCFLVATLINYFVPEGHGLSNQIIMFIYRELIFFVASGWLLYSAWKRLALFQ